MAKPAEVPPHEANLSSDGGENARGAFLNVDKDTRLEFLHVLSSTPAIDPGADNLGKSWHGRLVREELATPTLTWQSQRKPRDDKHGKTDGPDWLTASEYKDDPQALACKVSLLASLLRCSKKTLAYTGAGLSVGAGIDMAAACSGKLSRWKAAKSSPLEADPTIAHCIMAELNKRDLLHGWVQQNHDGLPQKAGYRQEDINEIHGSFYDPSNPIVLYSGSLRKDLANDMQSWAESADLVLVLGTSLSGLNADQCVKMTASRSLQRKSSRKASSLGSVIISPQRTPEDGQASLRIFATADEVMTALAGALHFKEPSDPHRRRAQFSSTLRAKVPYDRHGKRSEKVETWWDLSPGSKLAISPHNNIKDSQQPAYHAITPEIVGTALPLNESTCSIGIKYDNSAGKHLATMQLGVWWIDAAIRGGVEHLPVVNVDVVEELRVR